MESPATGTPKFTTRSARKPLQPLNPPADALPPTQPDPKPIKIILSSRPIQQGSGKENLPTTGEQVTTSPTQASLSEELAAARRRRDRLRRERQRTGALLDARAAAMERSVAEWGRRRDEQKRLEMEIFRLIRIKEGLGSPPASSSTFMSLRAIYEQKRSIREAQLPEDKCQKEKEYMDESLNHIKG